MFHTSDTPSKSPDQGAKRFSVKAKLALIRQHKRDRPLNPMHLILLKLTVSSTVHRKRLVKWVVAAAGRRERLGTACIAVPKSFRDRGRALLSIKLGDTVRLRLG
jgi:hypothetical protein